MSIAKLQFPQISRLFTALLWILLLCLFYVNVSTLRTNAYFLQILQRPFAANAHVEVASTLWDKGFQQAAKRELLLAQDLAKPDDAAVLGATTLQQEWEEQPKMLEASYSYWKQVTDEKSDYRDAFVQAGALSYEMGNTQEAKSFFQKAHDLDPNFQPASAILSFLSGL